MIYLNSDAISCVDYDSWSQVLSIQFTSGVIFYSFYGVPAPVFYGLISAHSAGKYHNQYIRGCYRRPALEKLPGCRARFATS